MPESPNPFNIPIPPATLEFLIASLRLQTEMHLGLLRYGDETGGREPNLPVARHTIDLLAMLSEKTKGNVTLEEQRLLENTLTEMRYRYVQVSSKAPPPDQAEPTEAESEEEQPAEGVEGATEAETETKE